MNGDVYQTLNVKHGDTFVPTVTPSKVGYNFIGYNPSLDHIVVSDLEVSVVYEHITFSVIFRDHEGKLIKQSTVNYSASNVCTGYEFIGWSQI